MCVLWFIFGIGVFVILVAAAIFFTTKKGGDTARNVAEGSLCNAICQELHNRAPPTAANNDVPVCNSDHCRYLYENCKRCTVDAPEECNPSEYMRLVSIKCDSLTVENNECERACDFARTGFETAVYCDGSSYCASRDSTRNEPGGGYCCAFPNMHYCGEHAAAINEIDQNCSGDVTESRYLLCREACFDTAIQYEWDAHGNMHQSLGACRAEFCYGAFSDEGGPCYACSVSDRTLCTEEDLVKNIQDQCDD